MSLFFRSPPQDFMLSTEVSTCCFFYKKNVLLLRRVGSSKWAVPGGKLEKGETAEQALLREIQEELGDAYLQLEYSYSQSVFVRHALCDYKLHLFTSELPSTFPIRLNSEEHDGFKWLNQNMLKDINLLEGQLEAYYLSIYLDHLVAFSG